MSVVFNFNASLNDVAPVFSISFSVYLMRMIKNVLFMNVICMLFPLCSRLRLSLVSVEFDFNTSLNDFVPVSPMLLSVDFMRMEKSGYW